MKHIDIELVNIQSHEHTRFHLEPGLNFILAEDNNVGKSTIFKVIMFAMQLPKVDDVDANELIRGGCSSAKAMFTVEGVIYTMWLFRDGNQRARAFFEIKDPNGETTRSMNAPLDLKQAFDIVLSNDGKVVNFNDADSIQLVVQDTPKNDEVLSKVLIDLRVENVKANATKLLQETATDYRIVQARYDDAVHVLSTMRHCDAVGVFHAEYDMLRAGCSVLDALEEPCSVLDAQTSVIKAQELETLVHIVEFLRGASGLSAEREKYRAQQQTELYKALLACEVCTTLSDASSKLRPPLKAETAKSLDSTESAIGVLSALTKGLSLMSRAFNNGSRANTLSRELDEINSKLSDMAQRIKCPVKGEVFYTNEKCIPTGN